MFNAKITSCLIESDSKKSSSFWTRCASINVNYKYKRLQVFKMSMITATAWVPRGFAAPFPTKYQFDEEEFARISELAKLQLDEANEDLEEAKVKESKKKSKKNGKSGDTSDLSDEDDDEKAEEGLHSTA